MTFFLVKVADEVETGDFQAALKTLTSGAVKAFEALPAWLQAFASKLGGQEVTILTNLVSSAASTLMTDIENPSQITGVAISAQAQAIYAELASQNISTFTLQDVFSALNGALSAATPTAIVTPVATDPVAAMPVS